MIEIIFRDFSSRKVAGITFNPDGTASLILNINKETSIWECEEAIDTRSIWLVKEAKE